MSISLGRMKMDRPSNVVAYATYISKRRSRPLTAGETAGQILLFTGVRYERMAEPAPKPANGRKTGGAPRRRSRG